MQKGNPVAQAMIKEVYDVCDDAWRGIGVIPNSGLRLKDEYAAYDVERALPIHLERLLLIEGLSMWPCIARSY